MKGIVALAMALLAVSCTGAEPEENTESRAGAELTKSRPEPRFRALEPINAFAVNRVLFPPSLSTPSSAISIPDLVSFRRTKALVAELHREQPTWLRYIRSVYVQATEDSLLPPATAQVKTGIFINDPGRVVGRTICRSLLKRGMKTVYVLGAGSWPNSTLLVKCTSLARPDITL